MKTDSTEEIITFEEDDNEEEISIFEEVVTGTSDYKYLTNKPKINDIEIVGNKTSSEYGLQDKMEKLSNIDIEELLNKGGF